jgi:hypothetical protein
MNYDEFQRHIGKAGLKLHEFATLMDMSHVSVSNYRKKGEVPRHLAMIAALVGEMAERGIDYREILSKIDISPKKPREPGSGKFGGGKPEQQ